MKIIPCQKSFSSTQVKQIGLYACVVLFLLLLGVMAYLILVKFQNQFSLGIRASLLLFSYFTIAILYYFEFHGWNNHKTYIDKFLNNLVGGHGENKISSIFSEEFNNTFVYIRNCSIPKAFKGGGDIDGILVTPNGLYILEIKFYSANYEIHNGYFYKKTKSGLSKNGINHPIWQANKQREYITDLLHNAGQHVHVRSLIVLAHGRITRIEGQTGVYVLEANKLVDFIKKDMMSLPLQIDDSLRDNLVRILIKGA
jgi:hypothetical protein